MKRDDKRQAITDISNILYSILGTITLGLTPRQVWMLNYLHLQWCSNKERWVSPTEIGKEYGAWLHHDNKFIPHSYHSAAASLPLKKLVEKRLVERNNKGCYRFYV